MEQVAHESRTFRRSRDVEEKDAGKPYLTANIDRAIVMTQYDLRGFSHPMGLRIEEPVPKFLDATIGNFISFAANAGREKTDPDFVDYFRSSFDAYLAMCKRFVACCDGSEREATQLIIREFARQHKEMAAKIAAGELEDSNGYLKPLKRDNRMGKAVLALAEAFEVNLSEC